MSRFCSLFAGHGPMFGNNVSKSNRKTRMVQLPNLQNYSGKHEHLGTVSMKISTRAMRTIRKYGGLENCLLSVKRGKLTDHAKKMLKTLHKKMDVKKNEQVS